MILLKFQVLAAKWLSMCYIEGKLISQPLIFAIGCRSLVSLMLSIDIHIQWVILRVLSDKEWGGFIVIIGVRMLYVCWGGWRNRRSVLRILRCLVYKLDCCRYWQILSSSGHLSFFAVLCMLFLRVKFMGHLGSVYMWFRESIFLVGVIICIYIVVSGGS